MEINTKGGSQQYFSTCYFFFTNYIIGIGMIWHKNNDDKKSFHDLRDPTVDQSNLFIETRSKIFYQLMYNATELTPNILPCLKSDFFFFFSSSNFWNFSFLYKI